MPAQKLPRPNTKPTVAACRTGRACGAETSRNSSASTRICSHQPWRVEKQAAWTRPSASAASAVGTGPRVVDRGAVGGVIGPAGAGTGAGSGRRARRRRLAVAQPAHQQQLDLAGIGPQDLEAQAGELHALASSGHAAEGSGDEAADGVVVVAGQLRSEHMVELGDLGDRAHAIALLAGHALDREDVIALLVEVELVLDVRSEEHTSELQSREN